MLKQFFIYFPFHMVKLLLQVFGDPSHPTWLVSYMIHAYSDMFLGRKHHQLDAHVSKAPKFTGNKSERILYPSHYHPQDSAGDGVLSDASALVSPVRFVWTCSNSIYYITILYNH